MLLNDTDVDGDTLTVNTTPVSGPSNGALVLNADGTFTYTPDANFNGTDSFLYEVSDGNGGTGKSMVTLNVTAMNDDPLAGTGSFTTNEDVPFSGGLAPNATDVDGDSLTFSLLSDAINGNVVVDADGSFTYTPDPLFNGSDSFVYLVSDGNGGIDTATVNLTINPVNNQAQFVGPSTIDLVEDDAPVNFDLTDFFTDVDGDPLAFEVLSADDSLLSHSISNDGTQLQLVPAADANGLSQIVVQASDQSGIPTTATIEVDIAPVNDTVTVEGQQFQTVSTEQLSGVLLNEVTDVDGEPLSVVVTQPPQNGELTINPDGTFTFDPEEDFDGTTEFQFVVFDGVSESDVAAVQIDVISDFLVVIEPVEVTPEVEETDTSDDDDEPVPNGVEISDDDDDDEILANPTGGSSAVSVIAEELVALDPSLFTRTADSESAEVDQERAIGSLRQAVSGVTRPTELDTSSVADADGISNLDVVAQPSLLWQELDQIRESSNQNSVVESLAVGSVGTIGSSLIVGYVIWACLLYTSDAADE